MDTHMQTVGILSPGDMGHGLGRVLARHGLRVIAALDERSQRTRGLAAAAGIQDVGSLERLVSEADVVLSVLVPSEAVPAAERVAAAVRSTRASLLYADLNAVAPETTKQVGQIVSAAGARYVDGGIIGNPPRDDNDSPRIYVSGEAATELASLAAYGLDIRVVSETVGHASGLKMCYACLTKGLTALATELLVAAERLGLSDALRAEQESSQATLRKWIERQLPSMPPKAHRWVGEMEEIAATLAAVGLPPGMLLGAADVYRWVAQTPLGHETPEERPGDRTAPEVVSELAEPLPAR
jgi:3-hydroxyisobutyrate dehydrogenase-like beta-hydroxyacid dehydrogenase